MLGAEAINVKSSAYDVMSRSVKGQSDTKSLKRDGEMTDLCGTPASTWRKGERCRFVETICFPAEELSHKPSNQIVHPNCGDINCGNWEVEELCQEGDAVRS